MEFAAKVEQLIERANRRSINAAAVLGLDVNGYGIVRSLADRRIPTIGLYSRLKEHGRFSTLCAPMLLDFKKDRDSETCEVLLKLSKKLHAKPVLFVTSDKQALFLARNRSILESHFHFHWADDHELLRIIDKARIAKYCENAGVLAPKTLSIETPGDIELAGDSLSFPCIIKPRRSSGLNDHFPGKNARADSPEELKSFFREFPSLIGQAICQEIVEGEDSDVYQCNVFVNRDKEAATIASVRKLHQYPADRGHMSLGRSEPNPCIEQASLTFLKGLNYCGMASLEFRRHPKSGEYYFIEMNPRLPWYNSLFLPSGFNFPYAAYLDLVNPNASSPAKVKRPRETYWRCLDDEIARLKESRKIRETVANWIKTLGKPNAFAWWNPSDPLPAAAFLKATVSGYFSKRVHSKQIKLRPPATPEQTLTVRCGTAR